MGYETTMKIVSSYGNKKTVGYLSKIAELELSKVCCDEMGKLISKLQEESKERDPLLRKEIEEVKNERNKLYNREGNFTEEAEAMDPKKRKVWQNKVSKKEVKLQKKLPYIYHGDEAIFCDCYGDFLLICNPEDVLQAMVRDQAKTIHTQEYSGEGGYRRFRVGIAMLEQFIGKNFDEKVKVILYGH